MGRWEPSTDGRTGLFQHQPHHHTYTVHILPPYATVSPMRDPDHGSQSSHGGTGRINLHKCIIIAKRRYQPQTTAAGIRWPHRIRIAHTGISGTNPASSAIAALRRHARQSTRLSYYSNEVVHGPPTARIYNPKGQG